MVETQPVTRARTGFWRYPKTVWARKAMFQIHLWVGILLSVYTLIIGISGSILVFENELGRLSYPTLMQAQKGTARPVEGARIERVAEAVKRAYPEWRLESIYSPGVRGDNYDAIVSHAGNYQAVFVSAIDEHVLGDQAIDQGWLNWVADLHFRLLGGATGLIINGIGAGCLVVLCVSGAVIWWPGVKTWKRALLVDFGRRWKRLNFDLHSAVGFWTLGIMAVWGVSGIYFVWPEAFVAAVNTVSKASNALPPTFQGKAGYSHVAGSSVPVRRLIATAMEAEPGALLQGINYSRENQPLSVMLARSDTSEFLHTTWVYLDPHQGRVLAVWSNGENKSLGDWFIWLMPPLHFGTYWGMGVKVIWALVGTMVPLLGITGLVMYWNRYLSKKWRALSGASS